MNTTPEQRAEWRAAAEMAARKRLGLTVRISGDGLLALLDDLDAAVVEAAENADMATEFERLRDTMNDSFNHVEAERDGGVAEAAALREALQCLHDEQNGPPLLLPRHKSAWEQAMKDADAALSRPGPGAAFLTRLRAMEALLRRLEWAGDTSGTECVCCYATKANGHAPGCELAALLSAAPPVWGGGGT